MKIDVKNHWWCKLRFTIYQPIWLVIQYCALSQQIINRSAPQDPDLSKVQAELHIGDLIGWPCCLPNFSTLEKHKLLSIHMVVIHHIVTNIPFLLLLTFDQYWNPLIYHLQYDCTDNFDKVITVFFQWLKMFWSKSDTNIHFVSFLLILYTTPLKTIIFTVTKINLLKCFKESTFGIKSPSDVSQNLQKQHLVNHYTCV